MWNSSVGFWLSDWSKGSTETCIGLCLLVPLWVVILN